MPNFFILSLMLSTLGAIEHETKLSLCTIELEENSALITFRLFTDDLAEVIAAPLLDNTADKQYDNNVIDYLKAHFSLHINQEKQQLFFFSRSANEEVFEISFLVSNLSTIELIEIHNSIFLKTFEKQKNLVKLENGKANQSFFFDQQKQVLKIEASELWK
ncbi:MAG: DUF6702 family protein [Bacteroidota bacterium]